MSAEDYIDFGTYDEEYQAQLEQGMSYREREEEWVTISDVEFLKRTDKAILVKFPRGGQRWVPISQTPGDFDPEIPSEGDLVVTEWFADKLDEEGSEDPNDEDCSFGNTVALRESDKALQIRFSDGATHWIPKTQIRNTSDVQHDGDRGNLVCSTWIADQKGLLGSEPKEEKRSVSDRISKKPPPKQEKIGWGGRPGPDPDDDIPF